MQPGFFDLEERHALLDRLGDPLPKLQEVVDWEQFRPILKKLRKAKDRRKGGRPPYDVVLMLKVLVLQQLYNLSDDQIEYQIRDRYSFCRFLGLSPEGRVPDAKTVWLYRERIKKAGLLDALFDGLLEQISAAGYVAKKGQMMDATLIEVPKQRNTPEENKQVKAGNPPQWDDAKARQKDVDARWAFKYQRAYFGYKNHIGVDNKFKVIRRFVVSDAKRHDGHVFDELFDADNSGRDVWADSAYRTKARVRELRDNGYRSHLQRQAQANRPLTDYQVQLNRQWSRTRLRVEHVFGQQESMGRLVRVIGRERVKLKIAMMNLVYNLKRFAWLQAQASP